MQAIHSSLTIQVICRIGSLEKMESNLIIPGIVICRIGSLENNITFIIPLT